MTAENLICIASGAAIGAFALAAWLRLRCAIARRQLQTRLRIPMRRM